MKIAKFIFSSLTNPERSTFIAAFTIFFVAIIVKVAVVVDTNSIFVPVEGGYYCEGIIGQPTAINPIISDNLVDQILSSVVYANLGALTSGLSIEDEGNIYIVKLKEDLKWSDGHPLTSDDIVFTIKTIQSPEIRSPFYKTWKGVIIERISEYQVKFTLPGPYIFFEENINNLPVIPRHIFGDIPVSNIRLSLFNLKPVSSGPYSFKDFSKKRSGFITEYHFEANKYFSGEGPYIQDFYFKFYERYAELLNDFRVRNVDGFGTAGFPDQRIYDLTKAEVEKVSTPGYYAVFFNPKATSVLKKEKFREALSIAVDREKLVKEVLKSEAEPFSKLTDLIKNEVILPFSDEKLGGDSITLRKEQAREIISEIKEDYQEELVIEIIIPEVGFIKETAEFLEKEWESVGIDDVKIVSLKNGDFMNVVVRERNYEAVIFGNVLEHHLDLFPFWHSSERFYPGLNLAFYSNDKVDTALEDICQTETSEERTSRFQQAAEIIEESSPAVFLFNMPYTYTHQERLYGFEPPERFITPGDHFKNVTDWYVTRARVMKNEE